MEWRHIRSRRRIRTLLPVHRPHRETDGTADEADAPERPGTGADGGQGGESHEVQSGSHEGRQNHRLQARIPHRRRPGKLGGEAGGRSELYLHVVPNWKDSGFTYTTNSMEIGPSRSNSQQEYKWAWEQMIDEMAEAVGMDPLKFRLLNVQKPGTKVTIASGGPTMVQMPETKDGYLTYDSYAVE